MEFRLTIDVQNCRLVNPNAQSACLLQCPSTDEASYSSGILVREDGGPNNNAVSFQNLENLAAVDNGHHTARVHGILRHSDPKEEYQEGDQVWLRESALQRTENRDDQYKVKVVNLRTWKDLIVPLERVLWVPMYRKLGHDGAEKLITLAGVAIRRLPDSTTYTLAVIQQIRQKELEVKVREIMQQETMADDCQDLRHIPGGNAITEAICRRILAIQEHMSLISATSPSSRTNYSNETLPLAVEWRQMSAASALATPPRSLGDPLSTENDNDSDSDDTDEEADFERSFQDLENQIKARSNRKPQPVRSVGLPFSTLLTSPHPAPQRSHLVSPPPLPLPPSV